MQNNDLAGKLFGELTVLERVATPSHLKDPHTYWKCRCSCGREVVFQGSRLRCLHVVSCGCKNRTPGETGGRANAIPMEGRRFGRLSVLAKTEKRYRRSVLWVCRCDCGNEKLLTVTHLLRHGTRSCGCLNKDVLHAKAKLTPELEYMGTYIGAAAQREYLWDLTPEQFVHLINGNCHYCGSPPAKIIKTRKGSKMFNGVDRVDNSLGYTVENCVSCCESCNKAKRMLSVGEFRDLILKIYNHWAKHETGKQETTLFHEASLRNVCQKASGLSDCTVV